MKLCMFSPKAAPIERGWPGRIDGDRVIQLAAQTLQAFFTGGGGAREHAEYALADVDLRAPVMYPPTVRVFDRATLDFEFANTSSIYGPEDEIPFPERATSLEVSLGVAAVIGARGAVGGYTLASLLVAPELPGAKRRDFALPLGPIVVTEPPHTGVEPRWDDLVAHVARNTRLRPGDLLIVDAGGPPVEGIRPGDECVVEAEGIGSLRNRLR